jgi:hypothetical protein
MPSPLIIATLAGSLMAFSAPAVGAPVRMGSPTQVDTLGDSLQETLSGALPVNGDCGSAAAGVVAETGGELLSVQMTSDGSCVVTVLIPGNGGRPKKVTMRVPM